MNAPYKLGAVALLLASVSTLAVVACTSANAEAVHFDRLAQAGGEGPPRGRDDRGHGPKDDAAPQADQQGQGNPPPDQQGKDEEGEGDQKGKHERGKRDGGEKDGEGGPPQGGETRGEHRERDRGNDGQQEERPREKRKPQREETPPPVKEAPKQRDEIPPPVKEAPKPRDEIPPPVKETPKQRDELPPPAKEVPKPREEIPPPVKETPKQRDELPPPVKEAPKAHEEISPPVKEVPKPRDEVLPPVKDVPPPAKEAPPTVPSVPKEVPKAVTPPPTNLEKGTPPSGAKEDHGASGRESQPGLKSKKDDRGPSSDRGPAGASRDPAFKQPPAEQSSTPPNENEAQRVQRHRKSFDELKQQRREVKEEGGKRTVIEEPDKRRIIREDGRSTIRHDETERFKRLYRDTREERGSGGNDITIAIGPGGIRIMTEVDRDGRTLRRWRRAPDGRETILFDNRDYYRRFGQRRPSFLDAIVNLAPPIIRIPRERYIVDYDRASDDDIYEALSAPPVDDIDRPYSLEEVRQSPYLRDRMRRLDLDTITFDFGSWEVDPRDYGRLERVGRIMNRILERNPDEMFLIEGHTDAVGSDEDNLTLSDRRAETVAFILSEEFGVPAENLVTQGYGEHYLKVPTDGPERLNRRTAVRRITPLLAR